jgi:endonuclease/exonuclease/phosphatase family metal-dependent hydrolase
MIKIISFNILSEQCIDNSSYKNEYKNIKKSSINLNIRIPIIINKLKNYNADIMLLQEVDVKTKKKLILSFPNYKISSISKYNNVILSDNIKIDKYLYNTTFGVLVLLRKKLFSNIYFYNKIFKYNKIGFIIVKCFIKKFKLPLLIFNIHLTDNGELNRINQINELIQYIKYYQKYYSSGIILGGDFNSNNKKLHNKIKETKLVSVINKNIGTDSNFIQEYSTPKNNREGTYLCDKNIIDYIYVYGNFFIYNSYVDNNINCDKIMYEFGSDHFPVISNIILT